VVYNERHLPANKQLRFMSDPQFTNYGTYLLTDNARDVLRFHAFLHTNNFVKQAICPPPGLPCLPDGLCILLIFILFPFK